MNKLPFILGIVIVVILLFLFTSPDTHEGPDPHAAASGAAAAAPVTNRIGIPLAVRKNLGISFAKVELRQVAQTLRVPGVFELPPSARRDFSAPLAGKVQLHVRQYQSVETGQVLFTLDSPTWRDMKRELLDLDLAIAEAHAALLDAEATKREWAAKAKVWRTRLAELEALQKAGAGKAAEISDARTKLAEIECCLLPAQALSLEKKCKCPDPNCQKESLAPVDADIHAKTIALDAARSRAQIAVENAAAVLGLSPEELTQPAKGGTQPRWRSIGLFTVTADAPGRVERIGVTNGAWSEAGGTVVSLVDPQQTRFRAVALQSDLGRIREGQACTIVPPQGASVKLHKTMSGSITFGIQADSDARTLPVLVTPDTRASWARPGVSAHLEVVLRTTDAPALAVPMSCIVQDGLRPTLFRRNPENRDEVIRLEADIGVNDGRWVVIHSGLKEGDQVVLNGAYELNLSQPGQTEQGGHWDADGTYHVGEH